MKTLKLVIGIFSVVFSVIMGIQAMIAGVGDLISSDGGISGTMGIFIAALLLIGGIVLLAGRKTFGGSLAAGIIFFVGGILRLSSYESYPDLKLWTNLSLILGITVIACTVIPEIIRKKKLKKADAEKENIINEQEKNNEVL